MWRRCLACILAVTTVLTLSHTLEASRPTDQGRPDDRVTHVGIAGKVTDSQNRPIRDARVMRYQATYADMTLLPKIQLVEAENTRSDGTFVLSSTHGTGSHGSDVVIARKDGCALGWAPWPAQADRGCNIVLGQPKDLVGTVVDEKGQPVSDADVSLAFAAMGEAESRHLLTIPGIFNTKTKRNGRFLFGNMPAGATCEFLVRKPGHVTLFTLTHGVINDYSGVMGIAEVASGRGEFQFSPNNRDIVLRLPLASRIEGSVTDKSSGNPIGGVRVMARADQRHDGCLPPDPVTTAGNGTFCIGGLAAGTWFVQLASTKGQPAEWVAEAIQVGLGSDETRRGVILQLTKGGIIDVFVRDEAGKPISGANVSVRHAQRNERFGAGTDEDGRARIRVPSGHYRVASLYRVGYALHFPNEQIVVEEGETKKIEYTLNTVVSKITGTVRDESGNPVAGVKIALTPTLNLEATTDASGKFTLARTPTFPGLSGAASVLVARDITRNLAELVAVGEEIAHVDLQLKSGVVFAGTVVNEKGEPLAGAHVDVLVRVPNSATLSGLIAWATANENGAFVVKAVPSEHQYVVVVTASGYGTHSLSIDALNLKKNRYDLGELRLSSAGLSISGIVVDANDTPVQNALVFTGDAGPRTLAGVRTGADGKFLIKGISPGPILVMATTLGPAGMRGSVLAEGGATDVKIVLCK